MVVLCKAWSCYDSPSWLKYYAKVSHFCCIAATVEAQDTTGHCICRGLQQLQIASLGPEANTPVLKMTYLCVLVCTGEGMWSQWHVLRWEVSQEGRQWGRKERQQLEGRDVWSRYQSKTIPSTVWPSHFIQILSVCFEYRYVHSYETSKHLQEVLYVPVCADVDW